MTNKRVVFERFRTPTLTLLLRLIDKPNALGNPTWVDRLARSINDRITSQTKSRMTKKTREACDRLSALPSQTQGILASILETPTLLKNSDKVRELGELLKPAAGPPATERKAQKRKRATGTTQLNGQSSGSNDAPRTKTASQRTTQIQVPRPSFSDKTNPSIAQIIAFLRPLPDDPFSPENAANRGATRQNTSNVGAPRQPVPMPRFRSTQIRAIPVRSVPRGAVRKRRFETQCEFWLRGHCEKGDSCPFSHPVVRPGANGGQGSGASRRKRMAAATAGTSAASADATGLLNPFSSSRF